MDPLPLQFFAEAAGSVLTLSSAGEVIAGRVCTDSRDARSGDLFVALKGERFDGHDFLGEMPLRGVSGVMVAASRVGDVPAGLPAIPVPDTRIALGKAAAAYRARYATRIACVAGSNGKTTTKEMLAALLSTRFRTLKSEASFNNDIGVPLTLLRLNSSHQAGVLEAGTNHPGELAPLVRMIAPSVGLIPSIGREHLEHFVDLDGVVNEESALGENLPADGVLVLNGDQETSPMLAARTSARLIRTGFGSGNDWRVRLVATRWESTVFHLTAPNPRWCGEFELGMPGRHMVSNAVVALAAAAEMNADPDAARIALARFSGTKQRLQWTELGGVRLLDDTYNANADSMLAALETLSDLPCAGRRVAVLGDMAELGSHAESAHREVGAAAARLGIDVVVAIGRFAAQTSSGAAGAGETLTFPDVDAALPVVRQIVRPGDTILAKASRSSRLERVVEALRTHLQQPANPGN
jgi:UDP-N-acetylmuramoyl-tripeptide--D-alanyl-D-alanine ligase